MRLTVDFDNAASAPSASARLASMARSDRPRTQPEITSDSSAFVRVTPPRQAATERLVGVPQLRALELHRPHRRLHRGRRLPAVPAARPVVVIPTLVPGPAQELLNLRLDRRLHHQPDAQAGDVLQHRRQITIRAEQLVDLRADSVRRGYS